MKVHADISLVHVCVNTPSRAVYLQVDYMLLEGILEMIQVEPRDSDKCNSFIQVHIQWRKTSPSHKCTHMHTHMHVHTHTSTYADGISIQRYTKL